ncbi:hypothetical protein [Janibacter melonis]|uniref:hypothetical protein n=1 Tax=Janibacter melonis TaxID=262209 RepID=UPI001749917B|nr:hypothetical protein [Janibacter melonis]
MVDSSDRRVDTEPFTRAIEQIARDQQRIAGIVGQVDTEPFTRAIEQIARDQQRIAGIVGQVDTEPFTRAIEQIARVSRTDPERIAGAAARIGQFSSDRLIRATEEIARIDLERIANAVDHTSPKLEELEADDFFEEADGSEHSNPDLILGGPQQRWALAMVLSIYVYAAALGIDTAVIDEGNEVLAKMTPDADLKLWVWIYLTIYSHLKKSENTSRSSQEP